MSSAHFKTRSKYEVDKVNEVICPHALPILIPYFWFENYYEMPRCHQVQGNLAAAEHWFDTAMKAMFAVDEATRRVLSKQRHKKQGNKNAWLEKHVHKITKSRSGQMY